MIGNEEIKRLRSLREKKYRDSSGLFIVEGEKMVAEALASGFDVAGIYRKEDIGEEKMGRISMLNTPSPVLAVLRKPAADNAPVPVPGLCLALDSVRDPGNLGTIIRLADWFGISCIYASPDSVELYNPKVIQSTMGAIFRKKVVYCDLQELCKAFIKEGRPIYGTFLNGHDLYGTTLRQDGLVIMGNEANGISEAVGSLVTDRITIPSYAIPSRSGTPESLNVAIATAVTVAEFRRRG